MTELSCGDLTATWLPEDGMVGASLRYRGGELLGQRGGLEAYRAKGSAFGIPLLAPWANRLDGMSYGEVTLRPEDVKLDGNGLPKDGAMAGRAWDVVSASDTRLVARFVAEEPVLRVFPFPHALEVSVELTSCTMTVDTSLTALGVVGVPVAFGWHPLFQLPGVPREALEVSLPVAGKSVLDDRGIPTGQVGEPEWRGGVLGDHVVDAEFEELTGAFSLRGGGLELVVEFGPPDYPVAHAWAPAGEPFVAWEPMTAPTNALVTGRGLRHVLPGESFSARFSVRVRDAG